MTSSITPAPGPYQPFFPENLKHIPAVMIAAARWLCWQYVWVDDPKKEQGGYWDKPPVNPLRPGAYVASTASRTWSSFQQALTTAQEHPELGIGFALGDGWIAIDIDHCVVDGKIHPVIQSLIDRLRTYWEYSPSGRGVHAIAKGIKPAGKCSGPHPTLPGVKVEMYADARYITMSGDALYPGAQVAECSSELAEIHAGWFPPAPKREPKPSSTRPTPLASDTELLDRIRASRQGAPFNRLWAGDTSDHADDDSAADLALCNILVWWTNHDIARVDMLFRQSGLMREKWDSRRGDSTYGARTMETANAGITGGYEPATRTNGHTSSAGRGTATEPPPFPPVDDFESNHKTRGTNHRSGQKPEAEDDGSSGYNWPDPLTPEAFHGLAGEIVQAIEPHSEADPAALLTQLLVGFGNLIGRRAHFLAESDRHFSNLFNVIVGLTSKGRKGSSLGQIQFFLQAVDTTWSLERVTSGLSTGEGLIWAVRDAIYQSVPVKEKGRITGCEQVMTDQGVTDKRLLVVEPEFARVLQVADRKDNTLSAVLRQGFDTGDLHTLTRSQAARATHAHISLIGHITKNELARLLTDTAMANGFCNRFLWACARRSKLLPEGGELHKIDLSPLIRRLKDAVEFARTTGMMSRDAEARQLWAELYADLSEGKTGLLGAITSRAEAITMRLACLYALLDCSAEIRVEHLRAGLAVWRYCESSAAFLFGSSVGDPTADEIFKALKSAPQGLTRTDLRDHFQRHKNTDEIGRALRVLQELGRVRVDKKREGNNIRPTERWFSL